MEEGFSFWFRILHDHTVFIEEALDEAETELRNRILTIRQEIEQLMTNPIERINRQGKQPRVHKTAISFLDFKRHLLKGKLDNNIAIALPPTFINHMINEIVEFLYYIDDYMNGRQYKVTLDVHKLWLVDTEGHLATIIAHLDPVEKHLKTKLKENKKHIHHVWCMVEEFIGYLRAVDDFTQLQRVSDLSREQVIVYLNLITEVNELYNAGLLCSTLTPLMLDHMYREQKWYLDLIEAGFIQ